MTFQIRKTSNLINTTARPRATGVAAGTMILTARGEVAIEDLRVGERIITRDCGMMELRAISRRKIDAIAPVRIRPDSLGLGRPDRDVVVAPGQHVYLRDWRAETLFGAEAALVPAWRMMDGTFVSELEPQALVVFELHFDEDHILYANGMELGAGARVAQLVAQVA